MKKLIEVRTKEPNRAKALIDHDREKKLANLKKVHTLKEDKLQSFDISDLIIDTASKDHGAMDIYYTTPRRACKN